MSCIMQGLFINLLSLQESLVLFDIINHIGMIYVSQKSLTLVTVLILQTFIYISNFMKRKTKKKQQDIRCQNQKDLKQSCALSLFLIFTQVTLGFTVYTYAPPMYSNYTYPYWAVAMGWCISATSLVPIPLYFVLRLRQTPGTIMEVGTDFCYCVQQVLLSNCSCQLETEWLQ